MVIPSLVLTAVLSYLLGSVSFGLLLAQRHHIDLRSISSGNTGATNVGRALGRRAGYWVAFFDAAKGFGPVTIAKFFLHADPKWIAVIGTASVVGHIWPIWHGFRGGKGVATALGVFLGIQAWIGAVAILIYFALRFLTRRSSVGSLVSVSVGCVLLICTDAHVWTSTMGIGLTALVLFRHRENIQRLIRGEESPADSKP